MTVTCTILEYGLPHLPSGKKQELELIVRILLEEFHKKQIAGVSKARREARILKIILFGSYARGDWVHDKKGGYFSDYDLLIVVTNKTAAAPKFWYAAHERLIQEQIINKSLTAPVQFIVHSFSDVTNQLAAGRPFFLDIVRDGIPLYEATSKAFAQPGAMTAERQQREAQKYFGEWYKKSLADLKLAKIALKEAKGEMRHTFLNKAAFNAHQATESLYHCLLLTLTLYSPKKHNIARLRSLAATVAPALEAIWPQDKRFYQRCFELLQRAYVEARYSPHYGHHRRRAALAVCPH